MDQIDSPTPTPEVVQAPERDLPRVEQETQQISFSSIVARGSKLVPSVKSPADWDNLSENQKNDARFATVDTRSRDDFADSFNFAAAGLTLKYDAATNSHVIDTDGSGQIITQISGKRIVDQNGNVSFTCTMADGQQAVVPANLVMDAMIVKNSAQYAASLPEGSAQRNVLESYAEAKATGKEPTVEAQTIQEAGIEQGRAKADTLVAFAKKNQEALGLTDEQLIVLEGKNIADAEDILMVLNPLVTTKEIQAVIEKLKASKDSNFKLNADFDPAQFLAKQFQRHQRGESSTISGVPLNDIFANDDLDGTINLLKKGLNILPGSKEEEEMNKLIKDSALAGAGAGILLVMFIMEAAKGLQGQ